MHLELPIELHAGHAYLTIDNRLWILDTGSPVTFGEGSHHPLEPKLPFVAKQGDVDATVVSEFLGVRIAGVVGSDFLNRYDHRIDLTSGLYAASDGHFSAGRDYPLEFPERLHGIPTLKASIGGQEGEFIFDTGAQLSYHLGPPPTDYDPGETIWDFWLGCGSFQTQTFVKEVTFAQDTVPLPFGIPPTALADFLNTLGLHGVIGIDLISRHTCSYAPRSKRMTINR